MSADCIFCKIANKTIPATIEYEDDEVVAFRDLNPQAPHHLLIVPRRHIESLDTAAAGDAALIGKCHLVAAELARRLGVAAEGYRVVTNTNRGAGQSVFHIHFHLLAGRPLTWPPG